MKQIKIISHINCKVVEQEFNDFAAKLYQILDVQSHVTVNDYTIVVTYDTDKRNSYTFKLGSESVFLKEGQSPRGVRFGDKRPDTLVIDCYNSFKEHELDKYIGWLNDLKCALSREVYGWPNNQRPNKKNSDGKN